MLEPRKPKSGTQTEREAFTLRVRAELWPERYVDNLVDTRARAKIVAEAQLEELRAVVPEIKLSAEVISKHSAGPGFELPRAAQALHARAEAAAREAEIQEIA
ncbi:hypothetical protein, partial [Beijerinckia sp. L45]|uniref:hypothetical protein n=1 Tax=Beijerinckia sp. L45 TaxID=1641855 RepID=UPI001AEDD5A2